MNNERVVGAMRLLVHWSIIFLFATICLKVFGYGLAVFVVFITFAPLISGAVREFMAYPSHDIEISAIYWETVFEGD